MSLYVPPVVRESVVRVSSVELVTRVIVDRARRAIDERAIADRERRVSVGSSRSAIAAPDDFADRRAGRASHRVGTRR